MTIRFVDDPRLSCKTGAGFSFWWARKGGGHYSVTVCTFAGWHGWRWKFKKIGHVGAEGVPSSVYTRHFSWGLLEAEWVRP